MTESLENSYFAPFHKHGILTFHPIPYNYPPRMKPISIRVYKSTITTAVAALTLHAGGISSATGVLVDGIFDPLPYLNVILTTSHSAFTPVAGVTYAGLMTGTVGTNDTAAFFCAELNHPLDAFVSHDFTIYDNLVDPADPDPPAFNPPPFHNGSLTTFTYNGQGHITSTNDDANTVTLTEIQRCMLIGVFDSLYSGSNPKGFTTTQDTQDLIGVTDNTQVGALQGLNRARIAAAQLVIWEIIHEPVDVYYQSNAPIISLTNGRLQWGMTNQTFDEDPTLAVDLVSYQYSDLAFEFNDIRSSAYTHCGLSPVPEITSPVALIAGGLLFVRRRETRGLRIRKSQVIS